MIRGYTGPREYLDDLIALVDLMFEQLERVPAADQDADERAVGELELEIRRRDELIADRVTATPSTVPFQYACERFLLSPTEARVLGVLAALELSSKRRPRATIGVLEALVYRTPATRDIALEELAPDGRLFVLGLAEHASRSDEPWLATPVRAVPRVVELASGRLRLDVAIAKHAELVMEPASAQHLLVRAEIPALVTDAIRAQAQGPAHAFPVPLLVGLEGSGRATLVHGAARTIQKSVLVVSAATLVREPDLGATLKAIQREARLFDAVLLVRGLEALVGDEVRSLPDLVPHIANLVAMYPGPSAVTSTHACWPRTAARPPLVFELPLPSEAERMLLWQRKLGGDAELANLAAARYRVTGGLIERAANAARARTSAHKTKLGLEDVRIALRGQLDSELATLGRRVEWRQTWNDLVLHDDIMEELRELMSRVRHRKRVLDDWGFAQKLGKGTGLSALFSGPPGTGKTMVAGLIASELDLDLYQIDVSRLVSKWIGETEKNLARLFDAAAAGHAVLLFDEADSLFAKRTEVKSSNDRYANLEVNYLLQRMEAFDGISILTTNLESSVDEAFRRRLAFRINFPLPELEERERLWRAMLPTQAAVAASLDFGALARRFEMSGGYIRNAVVRAAYLAAADGGIITQHHLQRAATLEYTAMGKIIQHGTSTL
ncbi:MAG TPA: ATP-binding protein [Kofleriaceae bacterium]